jgi:uncharacterized membrane protein
VLIKKLTRSALIASLYVLLVFVFQGVSFGPIQIRVAEALTVLPILFPEAVSGIFVGVLLSNILGGMGMWDILGGSLISLVAAMITYKYRESWVAYAAPIVLNAVFVSLYLRFVFQLPMSYWFMVLTVGAGQAVAVLGLGIPLIKQLKKYGNL